jgi:hypothetical protein
MPKLSQSEIKAKADEWASLGKKIQKLEAGSRRRKSSRIAKSF